MASSRLSTPPAKGVRFEEVDGLLPENKELRSKLFDLSNLRGKYPQVFIEDGGEYEFVGDWDAFEAIVENDTVSETTARMQGIKTFSSVFSKCM
mmetsp:Transcript_53474/g.107177  ORF Transcript_53474/g.107177 Transcript_53474/m.107177 type:complete len:94 (+) Transcript_53474:88-369(+)